MVTTRGNVFRYHEIRFNHKPIIYKQSMEDNGMEVTITTANFDEKVIKSDKPVMLDFWASWCGPCRMVAPIIEKLAEDFNGKAVVGKVNVDEEQELAEKFKVMNIPTIFIMKGGQVVEKLVGARSERELQLLLEKYL
jgi:thioredoxin 1